MMRLYRLLLVSLALALGLAQAQAQSAAAPAANAPSEYRLGAGDAVRVLVYQNPDLTLETRRSEEHTSELQSQR